MKITFHRRQRTSGATLVGVQGSDAITASFASTGDDARA